MIISLFHNWDDPKDFHGTLCYPQHMILPGNGPQWILWLSRQSLVGLMKGAVSVRLPPERKNLKSPVADWLLADVAMEHGLNPKHVVELMSGRAYKWG